MRIDLARGDILIPPDGVKLTVTGPAPTIALDAGWGSTASAAFTSGSNDVRGRVTITSAGTGQAANAVATITFAKAFATAPFAIVQIGGGTERDTPTEQALVALNYTTTTTTLAITNTDTIVAAETLIIDYLVIG